MDIEKRIRQYLHAYDNGQVDLNDESLAALVREAVAEVSAEWTQEMDRADSENEESIKRQGLVRINHRRTENLHGHDVDVIDFWVAPPKGHVLTDDGKVRKVLGTLPMTAEGWVVGMNAAVWSKNGEKCELFVREHAWGQVKLIVDTGERVRDEYPIAECYSTREAAEAAGRGEG